MTRHRSPEEWIEIILDAAGELVSRQGYARLTMDAVAARAGVSKGGVYRFFANKRELALSLFRRLHSQQIDFDVDEAVARGLPLEETLFQLLFGAADEWREQHDHRVWLQILPETLWSEAFEREREALHRTARHKYARVVRGVLRRDGIAPPPGFDERLELALDLAVALFEGLCIQNPAGALQQRARLIRRFIHLMRDHALLGDGHAMEA